MISFEEAQKRVLNAASQLATEPVDLDDALGRVLAKEVCADQDNPPFDKSAMDGYACQRADLAKPLNIIEIIPAGVKPEKEVSTGLCSKIMTGAMVPAGCDMVVPVEYTSLNSDGLVQVDLAAKLSDNIMKQGENIRKDGVLLKAGTLIKPQHIAVLATVGETRPLVCKKPRIGVIATGDELVEPSETPAVSQVRNSNSSQLCAQVAMAGGLPVYYGIARDNDEDTRRIITKAMAESDVILLSGGVSMGDFDVVPAVLKQSGFRFLVEKVAVKPGKPTKFAVGPDCFCFGLPGNPVSTFIIFELFVRPFIQTMMGLAEPVPELELPVATTVKRSKNDRLAWMPAKIANGQVVPLHYMGSGHTNSLVDADGMIAFPAGENILEKGTLVRVRQI